MKSMLQGDWHFGVKQDDPWVQQLQMHAIDEAIAYSVKHSIKVWLQAGDIFDVRKAITHKTMEFTREVMNKLKEAGIHLYAIVGNHDAHYKNTLTPNACTELLSSYDHITIFDKPGSITLDGIEIDMIPWLCDDNSLSIFEHVKKSTAEFCLGHWELNGFYFYKGMKSHGMEPDFLKNYKQVWSGHFHTISQSSNVVYIGTPYTLTAGDANDVRGFWIFDTDDKSITLIENSVMWHKKISYPIDKNIDMDSLKNISLRVILTELDSKFTKFESQLESIVHDMKVVSKIDNDIVSDDEEIEVKNVLDLMNEYIDATEESDESKERIKLYTKTLYLEFSQ